MSRKTDEGEQDMATDTVTLSKDQFEALLSKATTAPPTQMTEEGLARAFAKTQRQENTMSPLVSTYNPEGERDHPKPTLRAKTTHNGVLLNDDTLTWEEVEALNALPPGDWRVSKANGVAIVLTVKHLLGNDGATLDRVEIHYPCKGDDRTDHRGLFEYCLDVLDKAGKVEEAVRLHDLKKHLDGLRRKTS